MGNFHFPFPLAFSVLVMTCENPYTPEPTASEELFKISHDYDGGTRIVRNTPIVLEWSEVTISDFKHYVIHRLILTGGREVWEERAVITNPLRVTYTDTLDDDKTFRYRVRIEDKFENLRDAKTEQIVLHTTSLVVPAEYESMQEAYDTPLIDDGDTIFVEYVNPHTYARPFRFMDKDVYVKGVGGSEEVIVSHGDAILLMNRGTLDGFTFTRGGVTLSGTALMTNSVVTGVFTSGLNATLTLRDSSEIRNCLISGNGKRSFYGGGGDGTGIVLRDHSIVRNSRITRNITSEMGGGISVHGEPTIVNTIIDKNTAEKGGGGIASMGASGPRVVNCVIVGNSAGGNGQWGAMTMSKRGTVINTIVWGNSSSGSEGLLWRNASYSDIQGYSGGTGNISASPEFVDPASGDFRLRSGSPCIDAGHPGQEFQDLDGTRNDMGAFGGPHGE